MTSPTTAISHDGSLQTIKALDSSSVHRISSGQVVVDLQTAVKELLENSLDAGATNVEVRFKDHGLSTFEVVDNGSGIAPQDYDAIALKHHTSKLSAFSDLTSLSTFGFRGEALSSLCALADSVTVTTATASETPMGTVIEFDRTGHVVSRDSKVARQRGTTVAVAGLFKPLPVRRKELERNAKREFGKALALLSAYALVPCAQENRGVRLTVTHQPIGGKKSVQLRTEGSASTRSSVSALWGPKALEHLVDLDLHFSVEIEKAVLRRQGIIDKDGHSNEVHVRGLVSRFAVGCGRASTDRQFFFINGRPCNPSKVQKAFNEVYRTFNANQVPFVVADFILPTDSCDVNVSPDKRTILLHSENSLVQALKSALEETFASSRATYDVNSSHAATKQGTQAKLREKTTNPKCSQIPLFLDDDEDVGGEGSPQRREAFEEQPVLSNANDFVENEAFGEPRLLMPSASPLPEIDASPESGASSASEVVINSPPYHAPSHSPTRLSWVASADTSLQNSPEVPSLVSRDDTTLESDHDELNMHSDVAEEVQLVRSPTVTQIQMDPRDIEINRPPTVTQLRGIVDRFSSTSGGEAPTNTDIAKNLSEKAPKAGPSRAPPSVCSAGQKRPLASHVDSNSSTARTVQMVLSTSGTAWDLHAGNRDSEPENKRRRVDNGNHTRDSREARQDLRAHLRGFARTGSQVVDVDMEDEEQVLPQDEAVAETSNDAEDAVMVIEESDVGQDVPNVNDSTSEVAKTSYTDFSDRNVIPVDDSSSFSVRQITVDSDITTSSTSSALPLSQESRPEVVRTTDSEDVSLSISLSHITDSWQRLQERLTAGGTPTREPKLVLDAEAGVVTEDDIKAVETLSRVIDKADFGVMEVVGQFNLGFIIARRRKEAAEGVPAMDDLFIVDQHAADEKYNFETLQQTTKIDSQKLFRPLPLELTAADEMLATERVDMLHQNGFEIDIADDPLGGSARLRLVAQPISKSTVFDVKDLEELLHLMHNAPDGQIVRCSKVRAMFAMRACRKSVMVGMPLTRSQMVSVVRHMGTMDQPWHCPHGRPTMRHLSDITGEVGRQWSKSDLQARPPPMRPVDWSLFGKG
ncbi:DNA mismatch repair protein [Sparassis crispa]|uniref:DNA mismatch repair protein PMS1 n=1 Tax=Sparassis crispa TaxID=139825 RepID=A0A401GYR1_9APHY|nr:DNA mismatch repair protein [Sparassis crispa]GBE87291.1 DNA mismatch repair protein [Sparassis crispa]